MSTRSSFSLGRALGYAFTSLPAAWGGAGLALLLLWAAGSFGQFLPFGLVPNILVVLGVLIASYLMAQGALYRTFLFGSTAAREGRGIGGLQFGAPELRLLAADLIVAAFCLLIAAAVLVVFAVAFNAAGMNQGYDNTAEALQALLQRRQGADWVFIVYMAASHLFLLFLGLKLCLRHAATVAERRIVTLNALGLSSGNVWKLFCGLFLLIAPLAAVCVFVGHHGHMPMHTVTHSVAGDAEMLTPRFIGHAALHAVLVFLVVPLASGFLSSAYRQIVDLRAK